MNKSIAKPSSAPALRPFLPFLLLLFVGSGCAALIYEIVWLQMLQLMIGSTGVSLGVLLGTFMGGMCLGSYLMPRWIARHRHPLRVYAFLELGTGVIGLLLLFGMPYLENFYALYGTFGGHNLFGILLRGLVAGICLLPPTVLMGATLPAIARWVETSPQGVSWLGFFYGGNIVGAVIGCLAAGFYLLRVHDMATATYAAFGLNVLVALIALGLAVPAPFAAPAEEDRTAVESAPAAWAVYLTIAISGAAALGAEVVWTRIISLMLGGTVYTFSLILAVFLMGLGIGSSLGAFLARSLTRPRLGLGICQMLLIAAITWTARMTSESLPYWPINPGDSQSPWYTFQLDLVRCLWAVLPPACLWGASFPLALGSVAARGQDPGRLVGGVYAANTIGAIVGALAFSMVLVPALGTLGAQQVLIGLAVLAMLVALIPLFWLSAPAEAGAEPRSEAGIGVAVMLTAGAFVAYLFINSLNPIPWEMVAYGRQFAGWKEQPLIPGIVTDKEALAAKGGHGMHCVFVGEGMNVSVAVTLTEDGYRSFHGAGKVQASTMPADMRLQRLLGHITGLLHKKPEKVLVVACGAGVTPGCFVVHPEVERIVICDIEPLVPTRVTPMFGKENYHVVDGIKERNPDRVNGKEVEVVFDDGRHYLRTTKEKFDVITSDPIDPWVKGCAALNTVEYYEMCKEHLNPGGIVALWIPLYESNLDTAKSVIGTFFKVFPNGILWTNDLNGQGYDAVLFGTVEPLTINLDELAARLDRPDHQRVKQSLMDVNFGTDSRYDVVTDMLSTYAGKATRMTEWSKDAQINTDRNLRLQYLAGMWLNKQMGKEILDSIVKYYQFPDETFVGSPARIRMLKAALEPRELTAVRMK